jgi:hypothetical protein
MRSPGDRWAILRDRAPFAILTIAVATTLAGLIGWVNWFLTGDWSIVIAFFRYPSAFLTLLFAITEVGFCFYSRSQFARQDRLRSAWTAISLAAACHLAGRSLTTFGSTLHGANLSLYEAGQVIGGPLQEVLLLAGLTKVLSSFRCLAMRWRLNRVDYLLLGFVATLTVRTFFGIYQFVAAGKAVTWSQAILWTSDPLLVLLLIVAVFIRRSVVNLGYGMIANCWRSYVAGIALTSLGNASLWCLACSSFPIWSSLGWYVWLMADAAFALGPAYQVAAIERVHARSRIFEEIAIA